MALRRIAPAAALLTLALFAWMAWPSTRAQQAPAAAQQSPTGAPAVLRAESRLVRVDVVVTDKKGNYVRDLTAKDFHVFDNDKEQSIVNFSFGSSSTNESPDRHYLVLFFDDSTMSIGDQPRARKAALQFIDANVGPDRAIAVVDFAGTLKIAQNFTADAGLLKKAAGTYTTSLGPDRTFAASTISSPGAPSILSAEDDFAVHNLFMAIRSLAKNLAGIPGRKSLVLFTDGFPITPEQQGEIEATISICNQSNVAIYPLDVRGLVSSARNQQPPTPQASARDMQVAKDTELRQFESQPRLVLASYPSEPAQKGGGGNAGGGGSRGGTGTGGTTQPPATIGTSGGSTGVYTSPAFTQTNPQMLLPTLPDTGATNQTVLDELANGTGGFPIYNTNDLLGGLSKIAEEQNEYYLLGYSSPDIPDNACHRVHVKVDRGGTSVRSRTGYCNAPPKDMLAGQPIEKELEARASGAGKENIGGSLETPFVYSGPNRARVNVALDFPSSAIDFSKDKGKYHGELNVLGIAYGPSNTVAARFSDHVTFDFEKEEWKGFTEKPILHYDNQFEIPSGQYRVTVVISTGGQNFGKYENQIAIDSFDGKQFAMSAIALSNQIQPASGLDSATAAELLADRIPLVAQGMEILPSGSNRFSKSDKVALYAQVYDPDLANSNPASLQFVYRVVNTQTGETVFSTGAVDAEKFIQKGNPVVPLGLSVPIDQLPPGPYRIDIQAFDAQGSKTPIRSVQFAAE